MKPNTELSQQSIRQLILTNDAAVLRGLVAIYRCQTASEQQAHRTVETNGIGFSASDAAVCTKYAKIVLIQGNLPQPDIERLRPCIAKYARQLLAIAVERQLGRLTQETTT